MNIDLLNSATKYPSIPALHKLDSNSDEPLYVTEKIDGANTRIIVVNDGYDKPDWFIGSQDSSRRLPKGQAMKVKDII